MSNKRSHIDLDPDYEDVPDQQVKRQRVLEKDAKEATVKKIENIIQFHFDDAMQKKDSEINLADTRLNQARLVMDRLRACIVAGHYSASIPGNQDKSQPPSIHPTVKQRLGKAPSSTVTSALGRPVGPAGDAQPLSGNTEDTASTPQHTTGPLKPLPSTSVFSPEKPTDIRGSRFKIKKKIIVGNVSKFIPIERRESSDQATHKWMVYVRTPKDKPCITTFVKKVWFFLHPSYKPNDLVEFTIPPFHITRRGWGEFPIRVQLHFKDTRNKRVDIIHCLKLDKTCTGLQTLGAETVVEIELERELSGRASPSCHLPISDVQQSCLPLPMDHTIVNNTDSKTRSDDCKFSTIKQVETCVKIENNIEPVKNENCTIVGEKMYNGGDCVSKSDRSVNTTKLASENVPRVIHIKTTDTANGISRSMDKMTECSNNNHSTNTTSKDSQTGKQDAMYMKCKDQHGNLILLPYKLNPQSGKPAVMGKPAVVGKPAVMGKPALEAETVLEQNKILRTSTKVANSTSSPVKKEVIGAQMVATTTTTATSTTATALTVTTNSVSAISQPRVLTQLSNKPGTTNLVLKVTPTGLKLVPAGTDSPVAAAPMKTPSTSVGVDMPKMKSLLSSSPLAMGAVRKAGTSLLSGGVTLATSVPQSIASPAGSSKSKPVVLSANHALPRQTIKTAVTGAGLDSMVLANIGEKQYLLKVIPGSDNQILLVPNQTNNSNTRLVNQIAGISTPLTGQRSLLTSAVSAAQGTSQKSLTLSFGSSPFSVHTSAATQKPVLSNISNQKPALVNSTNENVKPCKDLTSNPGPGYQAIHSDKKIHVWKKKTKDSDQIAEELKPLILSDYPDLLSVIRASVRQHPVVREIVDRSVHPYCARSADKWLGWNLGKRRASEWQRAAAVRRFVLSHLKGENSFKEEEVWTTKKIMSWCRLHAFSPHFQETPHDVAPCSNAAVVPSSDAAVVPSSDAAETWSKPTPVSAKRIPSSFSDHCPVLERLDVLLTDMPVSDDSDEDIDIIAVEPQNVKSELKSEPMDTECIKEGTEILPVSSQAIYIQDTAQQIGVQFKPTEIESGVFSAVSEEAIFAAMSRLTEDILRESFSVFKQTSDSSSPQEELKSEHVFKALRNMSVADFVTNKHLGIHDVTAPSSGVR